MELGHRDDDNLLVADEIDKTVGKPYGLGEPNCWRDSRPGVGLELDSVERRFYFRLEFIAQTISLAVVIPKRAVKLVTRGLDETNLHAPSPCRPSA